MKQGISISALAREVDRQYRTKRDYVADTRTLRLKQDGETLLVKGINHFMMNQIAQDQLCNTLSIPKPYWQRMAAEMPDLLAYNVNRWFEKKPLTRMIRTLDGQVRAVLSDRFRPMDNYDLCQAIMPILADLRMNLVSCNITDRKLYLKALFPGVKFEVKKGDVVESGVIVSNSEVGFGTLVVGPYIRQCICDNGMCVDMGAQKRRHVGRSWGDGGADPYEIYTDETRQADDKALWLKVRDTVQALASEKQFEKLGRKFVESTVVKIDGNPIEAIEVTAKTLGLTETEKGGVLQHLIEGGDLSAWGVAAAVTRHSQDIEDYDRATELEEMGGKVIQLGARTWLG